MKRRDVEKLAIQAHNIRQWLARQSPAQQRARREMEQKQDLAWWLVYGPPRTGTSYMMRLIKTCATLYIADWGLGAILGPTRRWLEFRSAPEHDYITFDPDRFLKDISSNILDNAYAGDGSQIDLVYKQAGLGPDEYQTLVEMWGPPQRTIFCLRQPSGYLASATKKFVHGSLQRHQDVYVNCMKDYDKIGGDVFEYTSELSVADYIPFLRPLNLEGRRLPPFRYQGELDEENTSEEMWSVYHRVKQLATD